ncbi:ketopantoate reductase family protein [Paenibacillus cremeus]|uniref:2-dehydropantoate 2-reductase n=1 Tax=Paenibacillus cremeus TaxID=2163881 RepID=A0A559K6M8_9BACL|nr:ketopantoate reductase family protein [Paenibacillus cremeus]TVY07780.1 ketopantoate reductase family protein [Paenibacillus cremeus]
MNITIVGAGAVGGYFGGRMLEAGLDVTFLVREKRAEQLRATGLRLRSYYGDAELHNASLALHADEIKACDLVIVAVKNYQLPAVIDSIRNLVERGALVLPLLNGVEHFEVLKQAFGEAAVLGGMCQVIATLDEEGAIVQIGQAQEMVFGPLSPGQEPVAQALSEACAGAKMRAMYREDILAQIWQKYAFITAFSGITTASRLTIGPVIACDASREVFHRVLTEMTELAAANGVPLPEGFAEQTVGRMSKLPGESTSSMHKDFLKGLPLEVESLQGGALRMAAGTGILLPTVSTLYGLIKPFESGSTPNKA